MMDMLIEGAWKKSEDAKFICIGFLYGGHMGGECEIFLPRAMAPKFVSDEDWAWKTMNRFYRIVYLASPEMSVPIPASEKNKTGIVPDDWV